MTKKIAFVACSLIGYLIGHYFGSGAIAVYSSIMISYHLYLVYLVVTSEKRAGISLPILQTILTHVACVAMVVLLAMGRHFIPFFGVVRLFIPAIAPFEADWLFSGGKKKAIVAADSVLAAPDAVAPVAVALSAPAPAASEIAAPAPAPAVVASVSAATVPPAARSFATTTGEEYEEFLTHMREGKRPFRKPGMTVRQEFDAWLGAKTKKRAASAGHAQSA